MHERVICKVFCADLVKANATLHLGDRMKGTLYCTQCGTANAADSKYCFNCGQSINNVQADVGNTKKFIPAEESSPIVEKRQVDDTAPVAAPPKVNRASSYNFIAKHWRGEYSLGVSYWLFGFLIAFFIALLNVTLGHLSDAMNLNTQKQGATIFVYYVAILVVAVWQLVGVIRSASAHVSRGGKRFWAGMAKVMACLGAFRLVVSFLIDGVPLLREGIDMIQGTDNIPQYSLRLMRNNTELELAGGIPIGTTDAVRNMLDSSPTVRVIHLNSAGGRIAEANKLANLISQRQLITYTRASCSSACAIAFLAGRERYIGEQGRIGFHSASVNGAVGSNDLDLNASFRTALSRVGATPQFVTKATTTSPKNMWFPTTEELKQQKIITSVVDSRYFGLSGISEWRDADRIEQSLLKVPVYAALSTYDTNNYAKVRKALVEGVQAGRSVAEIQMDIHMLVIGFIVPSYLSRAPDLALLRYWRSQIAELKFIGRTSPAQCLTFLGLDNKTPAADMMSKVPKELANEDLAALTEVVIQTTTNPTQAKPFSSYKKEFEGVMLAMMAKDRRSVAVIANPEKFSNDPATTCNSMILLYDTILSLSDSKKAAGLLRSMAKEFKQ